MTKLVANARMYAVTPAVADAWARLFAAVADRSGVPLDVIAHKAPAPLETLWVRQDLGAVFMCGWPFWLADPRPVAVAAPVPEDEAGPFYRTDLVTRAEGPVRRLEDAFGGVMAWTVEGSHSGWNAPRRMLAEHAASGALFARTVGPVNTPGAAIEAVLSGEADLAPLDSFFHLLLRRHDPQTAARLRIVARTPQAPIPLIVAAPDAPPAVVARLASAFLDLSRDDPGRAILAPLALSGFAQVDPAAYALAERWTDEATGMGYPRIA